jgi:hypothetical protein
VNKTTIVGVVVVVYFTMLHLSGATLDKDQSNTALLLYKKGTEVTLEDNKYPMGMDYSLIVISCVKQVMMLGGHLKVKTC